MCMKLRFRDFFAKTAVGPITVYKVLRVSKTESVKKRTITYSSPHIGHKYKLGVLMQANMSKSLRSLFPISFNVNKGLHTFVNVKDAIEESYRISCENYWRDKCYPYEDVTYSVFECRVPEGSQYYKGVWASLLPRLTFNIVSNQLFVIRKVA